MVPITVSREFGSGGHSIAKKVAEELNIPFFDGEIVEQAATTSGYSKEQVEKHGETTSSASRWFDVASASAMYFQSPQDDIFLAQREVILEKAMNGPCVIVGRCSDYILKSKQIPALNVLIHAPMEIRMRRVVERYGEIQGTDAKKRIQKKDKQRRMYYKYYSDQNWGSYENYDLILNSGTLSEDRCVELICDVARKFNL